MLLTKRQFLKTAGILTATSLLPKISYAQYMAGSLQPQIDAVIKKLRTEGRLTWDETIAVIVSDLSSGWPLATVNPDRPLQSASMVKPFVIQAYLFCHYLKDPKRYPLSESVLSSMRSMIVHSNNPKTNEIMSLVGGPNGVQWILKKEAPQIFQNISIVENIPAGGKTYRNRASAADYTRFMHALWHEQLPGARILKNFMSIKNHDRLIVGTQYIPKDTIIYDKTGSTAQLCGDFGIIDYRTPYGESRPYTITGIIEKRTPTSSYYRWITDRSNVLREISDIAYLHISQHT